MVMSGVAAGMAPCSKGTVLPTLPFQAIAQMQLFADRTPAHRWWPNQFRLPLPTSYP